MNAKACERVNQFSLNLHTGKIQLLVRAKIKLKNYILYEKAYTFFEFELEYTIH